MSGRRFVVVLAVGVLAFAGWVTYREFLQPTRPPAEVDAPQPAVEDPEVDPEQMRVEPEVAEPGQEVELHFPDEMLRGVRFTLERRVDDGWHHEWWMLSDQDPDDRGPDSPPANGGERVREDAAVVDIGVGGVGPDLVEVPAGAHAGTHRICNAEPVCAELTVQR